MTATCKEIIHQPVCLRIMAELASPPTEGAAETDSVLQPVATIMFLQNQTKIG